jgi:putative NADH-flavin reductase
VGGQRSELTAKGLWIVGDEATGKSRISMEDFAIAFVDELEHPKHNRQRFHRRLLNA